MGDRHDEDDAEEREWLRARARGAQQEAARREREAQDERIDHLPFTLREASRAVDDVLLRLLRRDGVDHLSVTALHALVAARHGRPVVGIAHQLRLSPQAAGRTVRVLVEHGLVTVNHSRIDARVRLVRPSDEGEALLRQLRRALVVAVSLLADEVGELRLAALTDELRAVALLDLLPPPRWGR